MHLRTVHERPRTGSLEHGSQAAPVEAPPTFLDHGCRISVLPVADLLVVGSNGEAHYHVPAIDAPKYIDYRKNDLIDNTIHQVAAHPQHHNGKSVIGTKSRQGSLLEQ